MAVIPALGRLKKEASFIWRPCLKNPKSIHKQVITRDHDLNTDRIKLNVMESETLTHSTLNSISLYSFPYEKSRVFFVLFSGQAIYPIGIYYLEKNQACFETSLAHRQPKDIVMSFQ
jgi:hypothetical protein